MHGNTGELREFRASQQGMSTLAKWRESMPWGPMRQGDSVGGSPGIVRAGLG